MQLPAIDIPVQIPFDVPVMIHPVVVHFAIVLPVIALLLELVNFKSRNRAISLTSLFLITLTMLVAAAAWMTGKADGSHAAMLSAAAKEELAEHKLIGTYLVYASAALFVFKLLAMMIRANWMRDIFLVLMLVFVGVTFKQGKEGGELVYEYGVNVKAAQSAVSAPESEADTQAKSDAVAATEQPAAETAKSSDTASASEGEAPAVEPAQKRVTETVEAVKESANEAVEAAKEGANEAVEAVQQSAREAAESATEAAKQTVEGVQERANEAAEAAQEGAAEAVENAHEAVQHAGEAAEAAAAEVEEAAH